MLGWRGSLKHGLYASRDSRYLYVSNRDEGSVSLIAFATGKVRRKWRLPGAGSPDMGGVSSDGRLLWLSGRHNGVVYAIDTRNGRLKRQVSRGKRTARAVRLSAAGSLLARPHRRVPLTRARSARRGKDRARAAGEHGRTVRPSRLRCCAACSGVDPGRGPPERCQDLNTKYCVSDLPRTDPSAA
jgi:outer membrane protein assembly factor BamB